jgi:hypothetical protein
MKVPFGFFRLMTIVFTMGDDDRDCWRIYMRRRRHLFVYQGSKRHCCEPVPLIRSLFAQFLQTWGCTETIVSTRCRLSVYITSHSQAPSCDSNKQRYCSNNEHLWRSLLFVQTNDCVCSELKCETVMNFNPYLAVCKWTEPRTMYKQGRNELSVDVPHLRIPEA